MWGGKVSHCAICGKEITQAVLFNDEWACMECYGKECKKRNEKYYYNLLRDEIR